MMLESEVKSILVTAVDVKFVGMSAVNIKQWTLHIKLAEEQQGLPMLLK